MGQETDHDGDELSVRRRLLQTWWAPIAATLAAVQIVMGILILFNGENVAGRIIGGLVIVLGLGVLSLYGLWIRPMARPLGNTMILVGTLPWFGLFWMIVPPLVGLVVWIGVFTSGFSAPRGHQAMT